MAGAITDMFTIVYLKGGCLETQIEHFDGYTTLCIFNIMRVAFVKNIIRDCMSKFEKIT